ncbi:MAG: rhomboid family intramembrane serine protease [Oligosphaeraceae bacterium]
MLSDRDYYSRPPRRNPWGFSAWTGVATLIYLNAIVFLVGGLLDGNGNLVRAFALVGDKPWQLWRLVTYQFLHASLSHILMNMYGVWLFGRMVEQALGKARFLLLYLFSGVLGGVFFLLANQGSPAYCVGASGAEFGVMVAAALAFPQARFFLLLPPIPVRLWVLALVYCILEVLMLHDNGSIAHIAHLGGALGGFLFMRRLMRPARRSPFDRDPGRQRHSPPPPRPPFSPQESDVSDAPIDSEELNRILDKLSRQGIDQLTPREKASLSRAAEALKHR